MSWLDDAACVGVPLRVFYRTNSDPGQPYAEARALCAACPAKAACLDDALEWERGSKKQAHGFRCGMTPAERCAEAKRRGIQPHRPQVAQCGSPAGYSRHRRLDEDACAECLRAHSDDIATRKPPRGVIGTHGPQPHTPNRIAMRRDLYQDEGDAA